jgi:hypothetical protein
MKRNLTFFLVLLNCISISAQWNTDTLIRNAIAISPEGEQQPQMIHDGQGGIFVLWLRQSINFGIPSYYGQHIDSAGNKLWVDSGINIVPEAAFSEFLVISDDSSGGIVVWTKDQTNIYFQRFNLNGDTMYSPRFLGYNSGTGNSIRELNIAKDDSGGCMIFWQEFNGSSAIIKEMRIGRIGNLILPPTIIMNTLPLDHLIKVAKDRNNGAFYFFVNGYNFYVGYVDGYGVNQWSSPIFI